MCCERRVVAAAVLHVQHKRQIEHAGFERRVLHIRAQHAQEVGRSRQTVRRVVNVHAAAALVVIVCVIGIHSQHRKDRNQHQALPQHVRQADIIRVAVVGCQREHTARQAVHHVMRRRLHDNIAREIGRQRASLCQQSLEIAQTLGIRQLTEQQQIGNLLIPLAAVADKALHQILNANAAVVQLTLTGHDFAACLLAGDNVRNVGQTGQYALSIDVAQTALDIVLEVQFRINAAVRAAERRQRFHTRRDL